MSKNKKILNSIKNITETITNWDDLWIAYAISSLEIEISSFYKKSNLVILNYYLNKEKILIDNISDIKDIDKIALRISSKWKENSIPLPSVSDKILYIRDLLFLKLIYYRL